MSEQAVYRFGRSYQLKLAALTFRDRSLLPNYRPVIKPYYFDDAALVDIVRCACDYFDEFQHAPTTDALIERFMPVASLKEPGESARYADVMESLLDIPLDESLDVIARAKDFALNQRLLAALEESADDLQKGRIDQVRKRIDSAYEVVDPQSDTAMFYFHDLDRLDRPQVRRRPSGIRKLDKLLMGGFGAGELIVPCAGTGHGKSWFLANCATTTLKMGQTVVWFTGEMPADQVAKRFDQTFLGFTRENWAPAPVREKLEKLLSRVRNELIIQEFSAGRTTTEHLRSMLSRWESRGRIRRGEFQLIIDYPKLLKPPTGIEKHEGITYNYQDCRNIAREWEVDCMGPIQGNKEAYEKPLVTPRDFAGAYDVAAEADVILALCQTREEKARNVKRILICKARDGYDGVLVDVVQDPKTGIISETEAS